MTGDGAQVRKWGHHGQLVDRGTIHTKKELVLEEQSQLRDDLFPICLPFITSPCPCSTPHADSMLL